VSSTLKVRHDKFLEVGNGNVVEAYSDLEFDAAEEAFVISQYILLL
jgi:hypothetical protein